MDDVEAFANLFAFRVLHHGGVLPRDVRLHRVGVIAGLDSRRTEEAFGHSVELGLCENDRRLHFDDVRVEVGAELREVLAQFLHFLTLLQRKLESGTPIISQCFFKHLCVFTAQFRLRFFKGLDRLVDVLPVVDADRPILEKFECVFASGAHGRGSICFLDYRCLIRGEAGLVPKIVERNNRALKCYFRQILCADLVERRVRCGDRAFHRTLDGFWCLVPIGKRQN